MFGVSSFCLHAEPLDEALETLSGITGLVEIMDDGPHFIESPDQLSSYSFRYAMHAPSRGVNIASVLEPIRRASVEVMEQCFSVAGELDADVIVHPGYFAWEEERKKALIQFRRSLRDLEGLADQFSVNYFIENMGNWNYFFLKTPDELDIIDGCGFALDVGHANLNNCLDDFLECRISHVHLHDNDGKDDTHSAVGEGTIDFAAVMTAVARDSATPIVEVSTLGGVISSIKSLEALQI
jgi:sugar phosphate isomerase/epimerase